MNKNTPPTFSAVFQAKLQIILIKKSSNVTSRLVQPLKIAKYWIRYRIFSV